MFYAFFSRRRAPDNVKQHQLHSIIQKHGRLDKRALESYSSCENPNRKGIMQTWHHVPTYRHLDTNNNRGAMFVQPSKAYQRHFSIHPEWGLHTRVKLANTAVEIWICFTYHRRPNLAVAFDSVFRFSYLNEHTEYIVSIVLKTANYKK